MSDADENWLGHSNPDEHRTVGYRAWNYVGGEWCYPSDWCHACKVAEYGDPWDKIKSLKVAVEKYRAEVNEAREAVRRFDAEARAEATITFLLSDEAKQSAYMERVAVYALAEVEVLRAQVQAVRECTGGFCDVDRETLYDALDGSL